MSETPKSEQVLKSRLETSFDEFRKERLNFRVGGLGTIEIYTLIEMENDMINFDMDDTDKPFPKTPDERFDDVKLLHATEYEDIRRRYNSDKDRDEATAKLDDKLKEESMEAVAKEIAGVIKKRKIVV